MFSGTYIYPAEGFVHRDGDGDAFCQHRGRHRRLAAGPVPVLRRQRPLLRRRRGRAAGQPARRLRVRAAADAATPARRRASSCRSAPRFDAPPPSLRFFVGPKQFEALRAGRSRVHQGDQLRDVRHPGRAAARRAAVGERLRRQLRLGHRHPHHPHQPGDVAAAAQERRLDAADAGAAAAAEGHPGSLLAPEDDRPGAAEDERRGDGASTRPRASTRRAAACRCC